MKKRILFLATLGLLFSCNEDENTNEVESDILGTWELTTKQGNGFGLQIDQADLETPMPVVELEFQENYTLFSDNTFIKSRQINESISEASGNFEYQTISNNEEFLILTYETDNAIIESGCISGLKEWVLVDDNLLINDSIACDGPTYTYQKVE